MKRRAFLKSAAKIAATVGVFKTTGLQAAISQVGLKNTAIIDGLCFLPNDVADVKASGVNAFVADISAIEAIKMPDGTTNYKRTYKACMKSIKSARKTLAAHKDVYRLGETGADVAKALDEKTCAVYFQIQGADCVEENLDQVDEFYDFGLRVLQLTHHYGNLYSGGALDSVETGLSPKGKGLIHKLNAKNMLIDLSHSSPKAALDTLDIAKGPVVQTHGACRAIVNHARCSPDDVIRGIAKSGGTFGIFMMSFWLTNDDVPTPEHFIHHIKHVANIGGVDAVGIANDYPLRGQMNLLKINNNNAEGVKQYLPWWESLRAKGILGYDVTPKHVVIPEFNHINRMARIHDHLKKTGFTRSEADKILGGNWQRILKQVLV